MPSTRIFPLAGIVVGALALTGCIVSPPAVAPQQTTPTASSDPTTAPTSTPPASDPPSTSPEPTETSAPAAGGASILIDGATAPAELVAELDCVLYGTSAIMASAPESGEDVVSGFFTDSGGTWTADTFSMVIGSTAYIQTEESAPATYADGVFTTTITMDTFTAGTASVAFSVPCS